MADNGSKSVSDFSVKLLKQLNVTGKNMFFSPMSIAAALGMTLAGADGQTKEQMMDVVFGMLDEYMVHQFIGGVITRQNDPNSSCVLNMANRLYAMAGYTIKEPFHATLAEQYGSTIKLADFEKESEKARLEINQWVEDVTHDKIKNLIAEGLLDQMTRLVIVNAIYFKGGWRYVFDKEMTREETFHLDSSNETKTQMMTMSEEKFGYGESKDYQVLQLNYRDSSLSMVVVLPIERDGLAGLMEGLSGERLGKMVQETTFEEIQIVQIPRFKLESSFELKEALHSLGASQMFDENLADFGRIADVDPSQRLVVSKVIHKAFVDVNEAGTEAAAATAVLMAVGCCAMMSNKSPIRFIADHPFLFYIWDAASQLPLFVGTYWKPENGP